MSISKLLEKYKTIEGERFFRELFTNDEYKAVKTVKSDVILDIGACAGEFSAYIYDHAKVIYALEPYSEHFAELEENVKTFQLDKIKPFRLALADKNGTDMLLIGSRGGHKLGLGDKVEEVPVQTLAAFMQEQHIKHIDVLKIDIEGGESAVFKADDFHTVADKISFIIGEHLAEVKDLLLGYGFTHYIGDPNSIFKKL